MNTYQIAIVVALIMQLLTSFLLWEAVKRGDFWFDKWAHKSEQNLRNSLELSYWKRNAVLRDPLTGKYVKKDKHS